MTGPQKPPPPGDVPSSETAEQPEQLGFGALLWGNLRVLALVVLVTAGAYGLWRLLALLFPEVPWLQPPD